MTTEDPKKKPPILREVVGDTETPDRILDSRPVPEPEAPAEGEQPPKRRLLTN